MRDKENQLSMETVLASIREMIQGEEKRSYFPPLESHITCDTSVEPKEDTLTLGHSHGSHHSTEDVLELHHQIQEDGSVRNIESHEEKECPKDNDLGGWDISFRTMDEFQEPTFSDSIGTPSEEIVSQAAACATSSSFTKLADEVQKISHEESHPKLHNPTTVDELVLKAMRPLLKDWLDDNLPTLVETLVSKEIKKLIQRIRSE